MITRGTTPDIVLTVDDIDLANCQSLYVTIKQEARPNDIYINREKDTCTINGTTRWNIIYIYTAGQEHNLHYRNTGHIWINQTLSEYWFIDRWSDDSIGNHF